MQKKLNIKSHPRGDHRIILYAIIFFADQKISNHLIKERIICLVQLSAM